MDLISIIIPVYNKGDYVKKTINSVLNQTYQNFEIIIVNDGSTDHSELQILECQKQDSRIKYIKQENEGVAISRNVAINHASGKYISFLDADDYYDSRFLEKMLVKIKGFDVCYCGNYEVSPDNKRKKKKIEFLTGDILAAYFFNRCTAHTNSWLIKREFIIQYNIKFDAGIDWGEDMLFFAKVLTLSTQIQCVKEYLTFYKTDVENSLSINNIGKLYKDIEWINKYKDYLNHLTLPKSRKQSVFAAIDGYRLPAVIIYRLNQNRPVVDKIEYKKIYTDVQQYIYKLKLNNGIKSVKLYVYSKLI